MKHLTDISIIVPAFNEAETITDVLDEIYDYTMGIPETTWEVIVVDDASNDGTHEAILRSKCTPKIIRHPVNRGYGYSIKTGIKNSDGQYILLIDGDGQHIPSESNKLIAALADYDMVVGCRPFSSKIKSREIGKLAIRGLIATFVNEPVHDFNSGHRLIKKDTIRNYLNVCSDRFSFSMSSTVALLSDGCFVSFVDIRSRQRQGSVSRVNMASGLMALLQVIRLVVWFHPLRLFLPAATFFLAVFAASLVANVFSGNLTDSTLLFLILFVFTAMCGLLSDQIARQRKHNGG